MSHAAVPARDEATAETVADLLTLSERLIERAGGSAAAFAAQDHAALTAASREIVLLARGYAAKVRALGAAGPLPAAARSQLAAAAAALRQALAPHEKRLRAAIEAQRRLIGCIAEAAQAAATTDAPYARNGAANAGRRSAPAPVSLCRVL